MTANKKAVDVYFEQEDSTPTSRRETILNLKE